MSFVDLAQRRYSVRSYSERQVEEEKILQILEAARIAPSAVNYQPWPIPQKKRKELEELVSWNGYSL